MASGWLGQIKETPRRAPGTLTIIGINLVVFVLLTARSSLSDELVLHPSLDSIREKPWTLITVFFSHEIHVHFLINMALFFVFGSALEKLTSTRTVVLVYLLAGFVGSLVTVPAAAILNRDETVVGASAAVFGVVAAFAAMCPSKRIIGGTAKNYAIALFVVNLVLAIGRPELSVGAGAHAIGLGVGWLYGYWLRGRIRVDEVNSLTSSKLMQPSDLTPPE
jgi:membrane associated rhomboid family serine protease